MIKQLLSEAKGLQEKIMVINVLLQLRHMSIISKKNLAEILGFDYSEEQGFIAQEYDFVALLNNRGCGGEDSGTNLGCSCSSCPSDK